MTTKTQALVAKINSGTHRIKGGCVYRWVASKCEWVRETAWRKDVIRRADLAATQTA